jgi:hypothetical protein
MSFWASSYSFKVEIVIAAYCSYFKSGRAGNFFDCKETRMAPRLVTFSIESFDAMLGRVPVRNVLNRGPNCSMKLPRVQEQ